MKNEQKLFERLIRASQGLSYWSKELLKVNKAIEKSIATAGKKQMPRKGRKMEKFR
jgi:hypothetical protein